MHPIRLRGPADVLAALPYQLGYHPQDSLVVVALHDRTVGMIARIDLPGLTDVTSLEAHRQVDAVAGAAVEPLLRESPDSVLLVGYESVPGAADRLLDEVCERIIEGGIEVADRLVVRDGRWFSQRGGGGGLPPTAEPGAPPAGSGAAGAGGEGEPLPDPSQTPAVAEFVAMGVAPLPTRTALLALVAPDQRWGRSVTAALRRRTRQAGEAFGLPRAQAPAQTPDEQAHHQAVSRLRWLSHWRLVCDVGADAAPLDRLTAADVAELVTSLEDISLRDGLIGWLCPGTLPLEALPPDLVDHLRSSLPPPAWHSVPRRQESVLAGRRLLARLQWLARAVPDPKAAPVLTVVANVAWWLGDGTMARVALDRALAHQPTYRLARLLDQMVGLGLRVRAVDGLDPAVAR